MRSVTNDVAWRLEEAVEGLRAALNAMTDDDGKPHPPTAAVIGCDLSRFEQIVTDLRLLLAATERAQQREAA
jgi:hypothetical protein